MVIEQGTMIQIELALLTALFFFSLQMELQPCKRAADNMLMMACNGIQVILFVCGSLFKVGAMMELDDVRDARRLCWSSYGSSHVGAAMFVL